MYLNLHIRCFIVCGDFRFKVNLFSNLIEKNFRKIFPEVLVVAKILKCVILLISGSDTLEA